VWQLKPPAANGEEDVRFHGSKTDQRAFTPGIVVSAAGKPPERESEETEPKKSNDPVS
jgi:hypothetical protein